MKRIPLILIEVSSMILIMFLSIRTYLLGNGFYEYADQYWSIIPGISSFASFIPDSGFLFTRIIVSWPVYFFQGLPSILGEKASIVYLVTFYFLLIYLAIIKIRKILESNFHVKLSVSRSYLFFLVTFVFIFTNLENQNLFVDGGMITDSIISVLMLISFFIIFYNTKFWFLILAAFLSITTLLDPDYLPMFLILITLSYLLAKLNKISLIKTLPKYILSIILFLPSLIFIEFNLNISTGAFLTHSTGFRLFSLGSEQMYSRNLNILSVLSLTGHYWSTLVFTPPTILMHLSNFGSFPGMGYPIEILIIPGVIFNTWYISLFLPFIMSILSFIYRRLRKISIAGGLILFSSVLLALYVYIPPLLTFFDILIRIPYIGSYISTSISLPGHFLLLVSVSYEIMITVFMFGLLTYEDTSIRAMPERNVNNSIKNAYSIITSLLLFFKKLFRNRGGSLRIVISILLICFLLFSGWQTLEGDFFPARADAFAPTLQNGLVNSAPFQPRNLTPNELKIYDYIFDQNSSFNIYWPAMIWPSGQGWPMSKPEASLQYLPLMVSQGLLSDVYYYLKYTDVRYIVVENNSDLSFPGTPNLFEQEFGNPSYNHVVSFFDKVPKLKQIFNFTNLVVYQLTSHQLRNQSNFIVVKSISGMNYFRLYDILGSLGFNPVIINAGVGVTAGTNNTTDTLNILPPEKVGSPEINLSLLHLGYYSAALRFNSINISDISLSNLGGNSSAFIISSRNISVAGHFSSISSISYFENSSSKNDNLSLLQDSYYTFSLNFNIRNINNVSYLGVSLYDTNSTAISTLSTLMLSNTSGTKRVNFIIGKDMTGDINAKIFVIGKNYSATIQNVTYSLYKFPLNRFTPYGYYSVINGTLPLDFPNGKTIAYIMVRGNISYNGTLNSNKNFTWVSISSSSRDSVSGNFQVASILYSNISLNDLETTGLLTFRYIPFEVIRYNNRDVFPVMTVNSLSFFFGQNLSAQNIYYLDNNIMLVYYVFVVSEILTLMIVPSLVGYYAYRHDFKNKGAQK